MATYLPREVLKGIGRHADFGDTHCWQGLDLNVVHALPPLHKAAASIEGLEKKNHLKKEPKEKVSLSPSLALCVCVCVFTVIQYALAF